ncbi:MAG: sigma-70 family RNA polymerase sigma factor [Blastococcus sp.]
MQGDQALAEQFEYHRAHLRAVAYRMLGSASEAEDAVQEAWIRLSRSDSDAVANLGGWLTTVVGRVALDMLRSRQSRREEPFDDPRPEPVETSAGSDPEHGAVLAESVGLALNVVLDRLNPAERVAFVLHDLFAVPFDDVATILDRSPDAAKQLASRARRRVQVGTANPDGDLGRSRAVVEAFLSAARGGDLAGLLGLLAPGVVLRADATTVRAGAAAEVFGSDAVAGTFSGRARAAVLALVDGRPGAVWAMGGRPRVVFRFTLGGGLITGIEMIGDADAVGAFDLELLEAPPA